jgi:hypothetical protein
VILVHGLVERWQKRLLLQGEIQLQILACLSYIVFLDDSYELRDWDSRSSELRFADFPFLEARCKRAYVGS